VSNVLFDSNMSSGNGIAGAGSSVANTADSNSTGIRIKSGYDRGGVVSNVQYSNSCYQDHRAEIVFNPNENTTGSATPNFKNILLQNLTFLTEGTVQFTGTNNNGTIFPLQVTLDNVNFATLQTSDFGTTAAGTAPTNASLTYGPGQVSSNFINSYKTFIGSNGNMVTNQITESSLLPLACNFTYIAPELTGPAGLLQTITEGQNATAVVILTPAVGGSAYPTGTVQFIVNGSAYATAALSSGAASANISLPFSATAYSIFAVYSGDAANAGSTSSVASLSITPASTATLLSASTTTTTLGHPVILTASVSSSAGTPTGAVSFTYTTSSNSTPVSPTHPPTRFWSLTPQGLFISLPAMEPRALTTATAYLPHLLRSTILRGFSRTQI
jgi:Bacterial Ig-like domain (group 3)